MHSMIARRQVRRGSSAVVPQSTTASRLLSLGSPSRIFRQQPSKVGAVAAVPTAASLCSDPSWRPTFRGVSIDEMIEAMATRQKALQVTTLPNGFQVITDHIPHVDFSTTGIWIDVGSRFETVTNNGTAHFLEHLLFKGTKDYSKSQIDSFFESTGSHFNAYTARDRTSYYVKCFNHVADESMKIISNILLHSNLAPRDIELERPTIMAELREVESIVEEVIMDNLHAAAFDVGVSALPLTILGPRRNIEQNIDRNMLLDFTKTHYTGPRMTMVSCGGLSHERCIELAHKYFGEMPGHTSRPEIKSKYLGGDHVMWNQQMLSANCSWAFELCPASSPDFYALQLVHCLMGGYGKDQHDTYKNLPRFNSKFYDEKSLQKIQPFFTPYEDTGLLGFSFVAVPNEQDFTVLRRALEDNLRELTRLAYEPVPQEKLDSLKAAYIAAQLLLLDGTTYSAEDIGRQVVLHKRRLPMAEVAQKIKAVTSEQIMDVVRRYIVGSPRASFACIGHPVALPQYDALVEVAMKTTQGGHRPQRTQHAVA